MSRTENIGAEDEGLFISIASPHAIGKKWNIAASETFSWLPATGGTNAENVDYRFNRAAHDRGVCRGGPAEQSET